MAEFGALIFPTDYAMHPVELAKAIDERGLDSLFFPEHTHIPASRRSPYPAGADLPIVLPLLDQYVVITEKMRSN
jgi:alkanesulfonate monooxygenase SsuD/methylene tetrahydromethanopterin reductase-like flavin-dependent oxidoreductase (luciferase family)|tara:strand:+ start:1289 stop:1513 length:225 start_codon:yes stop_codon:yes gene_type:complete